MAYLPRDTDTGDAKFMNCPHFDPSQPTSHTTLIGGEEASLWTVHMMIFSSQPTSHTTMTGGGDAKFMHELSTLWPITAQRWWGGGAISWTVHTLTHHSLPPAQQWEEEKMPSSCMNCPHSDPSWPTSHTTLTGGEPKFVNCPHMSCWPLLVSSWPSVASAIFSLIITSSRPLAVAGISREVKFNTKKAGFNIHGSLFCSFFIILYVNCFGRTMLYMCIEYHI